MIVIRFIFFIGFYLHEVVLSNFRVAWDVITPKYFMSPAIVAVPIDHLSDFQILVLTNLITMTPGTLSLDVSQNRKELFIHSMYIEDEEQFVENIKSNYMEKIKNLIP
ncbi:MAG: Na+/H+ antiporter subunit E [Verrucomicrobiota bacterium]